MGVGTELKRLLGNFGIRSNAQCNCDQRALLMDEAGIEWCKSNIKVIVWWMSEEAIKRKLPFSKLLASLLVKRAIKNALKKEKISNE